jgi:hypothetical protein
MCDQTIGHLTSVNTTIFFRVLFCFIVFISRHLFAFLRQEFLHHYCKECMGRLLCLFVCYGGQELHRAMDGEGSNCIEESLRNGRRKVSIRRSMKEKGGVLLSG